MNFAFFFPSYRLYIYAFLILNLILSFLLPGSLAIAISDESVAEAASPLDLSLTHHGDRQLTSSAFDFPPKLSPFKCSSSSSSPAADLDIRSFLLSFSPLCQSLFYNSSFVSSWITYANFAISLGANDIEQTLSLLLNNQTNDLGSLCTVCHELIEYNQLTNGFQLDPAYYLKKENVFNHRPLLIYIAHSMAVEAEIKLVEAFYQWIKKNVNWLKPPFKFRCSSLFPLASAFTNPMNWLMVNKISNTSDPESLLWIRLNANPSIQLEFNSLLGSINPTKCSMADALHDSLTVYYAGCTPYRNSSAKILADAIGFLTQIKASD